MDINVCSFSIMLHHIDTQTMLNSQKGKTLLFAGSQPPMLNIVERCFINVEVRHDRDLAEVREQALNRTTAESEALLCQTAMQNVAVITPENVAAYFRHL